MEVECTPLFVEENGPPKGTIFQVHEYFREGLVTLTKSI